MQFLIRPLSPNDITSIAGWRYAAPYDAYNDYSENMNPCQGLFAPDGALAGFFCWGSQAQVEIASELYAQDPDALDFGIGLRPDLTDKGLGLFACSQALAWLQEAFTPKFFRLAVYDWNVRAQRVYKRLGFEMIGVRSGFSIMRLDMRPWREATHPLENGMYVYPGDPPFTLKSLHEGGDWHVSLLSMGTHCGSHMDAPAHIGRPEGVDSIPLSRINGSAQLLAWDDGAAADAVHSPRILLKMGGRGLTLAEAKALVARGVHTIGVDGLTVALEGSEYPVHDFLFDQGITILENIALESFAPGWYTMRCLPLLLPGSDGVPVRLLLREE